MATLASCGSTVQNPTPWVEASDYQNFADCITSEETEGRTILVDAAMYIETDITVPRNRDLFFVNGGMLSIAEGKVLRIEGTVTAALFQIFSGNGAVRFGGGNVANLYPQWWGATGDGLHDDTAAIQNAIDARYSTDVDQQGFTTVAFPSGAYYCSSTILVSKDRTIFLRGYISLLQRKMFYLNSQNLFPSPKISLRSILARSRIWRLSESASTARPRSVWLIPATRGLRIFRYPAGQVPEASAS